MSVIVANRSESKTEYLKTAMDLFRYSLQKVLKSPKRLSFFIGQPIVQHSRNIHINATRINSINSKCEEERIKRIELCENTITELEILPILIEELYISTGNLYTDNQIVRWFDLIEKETKLINGILKYEKEKQF